MKRCSQCGEIKPLSEFWRNRRAKDGLLSRCKDCHRQQMRATHERHPDRYKAKMKRDTEARRRKEAFDRAVRRDARLNKEERAAQRRVEIWANVRRWAERHPERHAEQRRRSTMRRYAKKKAAQGSATTEQIRQRWLFYGNRCWMCGAPATQTDHVIPLNRGGADWPSNQRPACGPCNRAKSDRLIAS